METPPKPNESLQTLDYLKKEKSRLEAELRDRKYFKGKINKQIEEIDKKIEIKEIEDDRKARPMLYYMAEKISSDVKNHIKNESGIIDLRNISESRYDPGRYETFRGFSYLMETGKDEGYFSFSISGFILMIKNTKEIRNEKGQLEVMSDKAQYKIIGPNNEIIADNLKYNEASEIYYDKINEYEKGIREEFEKLDKSTEKEIGEAPTEKISEVPIPEEAKEEGVTEMTTEPIKESEQPKESAPKKIDILREEYFKLRNDKSKGKDSGLTEEQCTEKLNQAEQAYQNVKNETVKSFIDKGEKEKAQEFIFSEVELKRKNDFENKLVGRGERLRNLASKTIEKWDNFGNEKGLNGAWKRAVKMSVSLGMIGITSSLSVEGLAKMGIGSASALSGGTLSYIGRKTGMGVVIGSTLSQIPEKHRKWVGVAMMAGSVGFTALGGGVIAGAGVVAASAFGYGLSHLFKQYDKKIKDRIAISKNTIDWNNFENNSKNYEAEIENILKQNEKARIWGKAIEASTALAGSAAFLEISGIFHDYKAQGEIQTEQKTETGQEQTGTHQPGELSHNQEMKLQQDELRHQAELKHQAELRAQIEEQITLKDATVGKGEGIENAFIRQIEHNHDLAKELGFKGDVADAKALHEFAGREAHIIALKEGYADNSGHEVRVAEAGKVAYEIKTENGHVLVDEKSVTGDVLETHHEGDKFESTGDKYEYSHENAPAHPQQPVEEIKPVTPEGSHIRTEYEDTSIHTARTEFEDTSKPENTDNRPFNTEKESMLFQNKSAEGILTDAHGKQFTEADWSRAAENPYHLSLKEAIHVTEVHNSNIDHLIHEKHLNNLDTENLKDIIKEGEAKMMLEEKDVKEIYQPLQAHIEKLHQITGLEPREGDILHKAETNEEYIYRAEMKAASIGKLNHIDLNNK